ncbi:hypothetical protein DIPPA_30322 [Diplonema papillatum]|nr:hypothetical protein DIPPA_30322 [Diplonema papillatum]
MQKETSKIGGMFETQRGLFLASLVLLAAVAGGLHIFLEDHEKHARLVPPPVKDPLFSFFPRADVSSLIFICTYGSLVTLLLTHYNNLHFLTQFAVSVTAVQLTRMITIDLLPLRPPPDLVDLEDPVLNTFVYADGGVTTDLFYSGHTAVVLVMYFLTREVKYLCFAFPLMALLIVQRIHYTIDICAAIPFAYGIVRYLAPLVPQLPY